jgi:hypothetical protein
MHQQDRYPAWQSWVEIVNEIREEIKGYNYPVTDDYLCNRFGDLYYEIMLKNHGKNTNGDNLLSRMLVYKDYHLMTWQQILVTYSQHKYMVMAQRQTAPQPSSNKFENDDYWAPGSVCGIHPDYKKKHANESCHLQTSIRLSKSLSWFEKRAQLSKLATEYQHKQEAWAKKTPLTKLTSILSPTQERLEAS